MEKITISLMLDMLIDKLEKENGVKVTEREMTDVCIVGMFENVFEVKLKKEEM